MSSAKGLTRKTHSQRLTSRCFAAASCGDVYRPAGLPSSGPLPPPNFLPYVPLPANLNPAELKNPSFL